MYIYELKQHRYFIKAIALVKGFMLLILIKLNQHQLTLVNSLH